MTKELKDGLSYCNQTIALRTTLEEGFIHLGERLHKIYEEKLYSAQWESFRDYLDDLRMDYATASKLIKIYQVFVIQYAVDRNTLASIGRESAYELAGIVKNKADAISWIKKGETLRRDDLRIAVREAKTGEPQADCKHPDMVKFCYCPSCHFKERI